MVYQSYCDIEIMIIIENSYVNFLIINKPYDRVFEASKLQLWDNNKSCDQTIKYYSD